MVQSIRLSRLFVQLWNYCFIQKGFSFLKQMP